MMENQRELTDEELERGHLNACEKCPKYPDDCYTGTCMKSKQMVAQAQLEKAEPLIRQDERRKLIKWLESVPLVGKEG